MSTIPTSTPTPVKHIVLSGGGIICFNQLGVLKTTYERGLWNYDDLTSVWGTSAGSFLAFIMCLKYDWETIEQYFVKRPWQTVFKINLETIINSYQNKGMLDQSVIIDMFTPLFKACDIPININMAELFETTKIDLHLFTTKYETLELVDISHTTHPEWKVVDALYCSCCLPLLFCPFVDAGSQCMYLDGGIIQNYPIKQCLDYYGEAYATMGVAGDYGDRIEKSEPPQFSLFDYISKLIDKMVIKLNGDQDTAHNIKYQFSIKIPLMDIYSIYLATNDEKMRVKLIQDGIDCANEIIDMVTAEEKTYS